MSNQVGKDLGRLLTNRASPDMPLGGDEVMPESYKKQKPEAN